MKIVLLLFEPYLKKQKRLCGAAACTHRFGARSRDDGCAGGGRENSIPHEGACPSYQRSEIKYGSYCARGAPNYLCIRTC